MTTALVLGLIGLALVDSTSIGTLFIPIWLLLAPGRVRLGRFAVYLGTIVVFYFAAGLLVMVGADAALGVIGALFASVDQTILRGVQLAAGIALLVLSFRMTSKHRKPKGPGRITRWRERALTEEGSTPSLISLALAAAGMELATMLPYLAAIGLLVTSGIGWGGITLSLAAYCVIMVLPAVVLIGVRLVAHERIDPLLQRMNAWMTKNGNETLSWIVGIAGFLIAQNAVGALLAG
ncbi:hypothetical protein FHR81_002253 [Actinoalloteichus hoggarensis]|uniref:Uncharacterized protein n=1 Tax=Actinoalloteichus hoggarensis TaxID=1470176 RepID=A0A221W6J0_9PSEU|nr:GAP family protein [Actinoalloteichus hoggarensis]ASO21283.1 hypothetical protein AHOG_18290 [Actinoalloteichus hoggarensis]MBB5921215.1 hypothetical protein [Actinoalloteichus hoggarensis]